MRQFTKPLEVKTTGKGLYDVTQETAAFVRTCSIGTGLLTVYCQHTSASLTIQENADPDVVEDLRDFFERIAPEGDVRYRQTMEGPDDMPAHIRAALTQTSLAIPVVEGRMVLGTWQGIYVFEHRRAKAGRRLVLHLIGE